MSKNVIGIDISDFSIEALALEKNRKGFKVESYARFRLSPEIVEDGRILNSQRLKEAILKMFKNAKPKSLEKSRKVFLSIPESQTFSKILSFPKNIKDKDLEKAALNKAEELIPEPRSNLISLIKILPNTSNSKQVFYSAVKIDILKDFVNIFKELHIDIVGITTEAISSFAGIKKEKDKKNTLLLDLGARTTIASIFTEDHLCSSINIGIGGDYISKVIAKKLKITYKEAELKKVKIGLTSKEHGEIMLITQGQLQPLVDELKVFIEYWQSFNAQVIDQVILIGGLSKMGGADKYFGDNLNLPTELGKSFIDSKTLPRGLVFLKYINALGLAKIAHQGVDIDFYKKFLKEHKNQDKKSDKVKEKRKPSRSIFKNKYFWIVLVILMIATGGFLFKDKLLSFYNNIVSVGEVKETEEVKETPLSLEEKIFVAINNVDNSENFIKGEYYNFTDIQTYNFLEENNLPDDYTGEYRELVEMLQERADANILSLINTEYRLEGYMIIPKIVASQILETTPSEEDYVLGDDLKLEVDYKFMGFSEADVQGFIIQKYPEIANNIDDIKYKVVSSNIEGADGFFDILVSVFVKKDI